MENQLLSNHPVKDRQQILKDTADAIEKMTYGKSLDENELNLIKTKFSQTAIELDQHDQKLKEAREEYKSAAKPLKILLAEFMNQIRTRQIEVTEEVYLLADQQEGMMGYYNKEGELIYSRPLMQSERQLRIVSEIQKSN